MASGFIADKPGLSTQNPHYRLINLLFRRKTWFIE